MTKFFTSVRPVKDGSKRQEKLVAGAGAGDVIANLRMVSEEQDSPTPSTISWTYSQILHKVHAPLTHQQKQSHWGRHSGNYED